MSDVKRAVIIQSLRDAIRILENEPVRPDAIGALTVAQIMNRTSIAHLSIERAIKFVITECGGKVIKNHDLLCQLRELRQYEPNSSEFLATAFTAAVRHYRYNVNTRYMRHLRSLETYLTETASDSHFRDIRYWELSQSTDDVLIRKIYLKLHMELLHAMSEVLSSSGRLKETISTRVERAVADAMFPSAELSYSKGSDKHRSVQAYIEWREGYSSFAQALSCAIRDGLERGDGLTSEILRKALQTLKQSKDPAVIHFVGTLEVLPRQQRDVVPCVRWLGPENYRSGIVLTPAGDELGYINRRADGTWDVEPFLPSLVAVSALADSQTDARCYLADRLTSTATVIVGDKVSKLRIVGEKDSPFRKAYERVWEWSEDAEHAEELVVKVAFWDDTHGIKRNDLVRMEVPRETIPRAASILKGRITEVNANKVLVQGMEYLGTIS